MAEKDRPPGPRVLAKKHLATILIVSLVRRKLQKLSVTAIIVTRTE